MPDGRDIIKVKKVTLTGQPNSVTHYTNERGGIDRNFYGPEGRQQCQISNHNHENPAKHPYGKNGEHAHDYVFDKNGKIVSRKERELTEQERRENSDII